MATERFIRGKRDSCHHDGLASIRRREQAADYHLKHWQEEAEPLDEVHVVYERPVQQMRRGNTRVVSEQGLLQELRSTKLNENSTLFIQTSQDSQHGGGSSQTEEAST